MTHAANNFIEETILDSGAVLKKTRSDAQLPPTGTKARHLKQLKCFGSSKAAESEPHGDLRAESAEDHDDLGLQNPPTDPEGGLSRSASAPPPVPSLSDLSRASLAPKSHPASLARPRSLNWVPRPPWKTAARSHSEDASKPHRPLPTDAAPPTPTLAATRSPAEKEGSWRGFNLPARRGSLLAPNLQPLAARPGPATPS